MVSQETMFFWNLAPGDTGFLQAPEIFTMNRRGDRGSSRVRCYRKQQQDRLVNSFPVELYMYTHRYYTHNIYIYTYIYIISSILNSFIGISPKPRQLNSPPQ